MTWRGDSFNPVGVFHVKPMKNVIDDSNPTYYAANLAADIGKLHSQFAEKQPDWWRLVLSELHSHLDFAFPEIHNCEECGAALYTAFATCEECGHKFNQGADVIPPFEDEF